MLRVLSQVKRACERERNGGSAFETVQACVDQSALRKYSFGWIMGENWRGVVFTVSYLTRRGKADGQQHRHEARAVSYTHLTLPTIYSV